MKLSYLTILIVLLIFGCAKKPTNINGTYKSDVSYYESLIRSNPDVTEDIIKHMTLLQPQLIIDYPNCTFIHPTPPSSRGNTDMKAHSIIGSIRKVNKELYLFIMKNSDGTNFTRPIYFNTDNGSLYTSGKKFDKSANN
jgi:hypothetical protein